MMSTGRKRHNIYIKHDSLNIIRHGQYAVASQVTQYRNKSLCYKQIESRVLKIKAMHVADKICHEYDEEQDLKISFFVVEAFR